MSFGYFTAVRLHVYLDFVKSIEQELKKISAVRFFAIFGSYGSVFGHFLGVPGRAH